MQRLVPCCWAGVLLAFIFVADLGGEARAAEPPIRQDEARAHVRWQDARRVVGRTAFVSGKIVRVGHTRRVHFLDFSRDDRTAFTAVVFTDALEKFPDRLEALYENKLVEIFGPVTLYAGNPQIVVAKPEQIRVMDELPPVVLPAEYRVPVGDKLRIASFNVRNLFDDQDDPYRNDETTPTKSREEMERLAHVLREVNADVVALQEVESRGYLQRFLDVFLADLAYRHVVHFEGNDQRGIDVCVVSRIPVGQVISQRHRTFPGPDGQPMSFQRDVLQVELLPVDAPSFEVWVVHLKSNSGGREAAEPVRLAEANMLRELLDTRLADDPELPVVLCGDFNDTLDSVTLQTILGEGPTALRTFVADLPAGERVTYNEEPYRDMIDFLFCSPQMAVRYVPQSYRIRVGVLDTNGSDHNPVFADFVRGER